MKIIVDFGNATREFFFVGDGVMETTSPVCYTLELFIRWLQHEVDNCVSLQIGELKFSNLDANKIAEWIQLAYETMCTYELKEIIHPVLSKIGTQKWRLEKDGSVYQDDTKVTKQDFAHQIDLVLTSIQSYINSDDKKEKQILYSLICGEKGNSVHFTNRVKDFAKSLAKLQEMMRVMDHSATRGLRFLAK